MLLIALFTPSSSPTRILLPSMGLSARDHVGSALLELHWLPLAHCIKFKVALLMYMAHNRLCPLYISEMLAPVSSTSMCCQRWQLCSSGSSNYIIPRTRTMFSDRAFSVAGPVIWNSIPSSSEQPTTFKHSNVYSKCTFSTFLTDLINATITVLLS